MKVNEYKLMMDHAKPPAHLNERTLKRIEALRVDGGVEWMPKQSFTVKKHRPTVAVVKLLTGALAAVLVAGAVIVIPSLVLHPNYDPADTEPQASSFADLFGLALYADAGEVGRTVDIATGESGIMPHGGEGAFPITALLYMMNLTCVGENIETITYAVDGERVSFETVAMKMLQDGMLVPDTYTYSKSFTVDYDEQQPEDFWYRLKVDLRSPELLAVQDRVSELFDTLSITEDPDKAEALENEIDELQSRYDEIIHSQDNDVPDDYEAMTAQGDIEYYDAECKALNIVGEATFSITAAFTDGSSAVKRYRIAPVENYEQVLADRMAASREPGRADDDPRLTASLFTITEIS